MKMDSWLKYIATSISAHELREIFNRTFALVENPDVHNLFFERIDFLRKRSVNGSEVRSLDDLRDDIELELETQSRLNSELKKVALYRIEKNNKELKNDELLINSGEEFIVRDDLYLQSDLWPKVERELILKTLLQCDWNRTLAAKALGISIRTLRNKIHFYQGTTVPSLPHNYGSRGYNRAEQVIQ